MNDDVLSKAFARFPSFNMAKVSVTLYLIFPFSTLVYGTNCYALTAAFCS